ncbi:MAG: 4'-phosphopantetheinyl transferase superfamily protein [Bacteroidota bacterium]
MPLIKHMLIPSENDLDGEVGLWRIEEEEAQLQAGLWLSPEEHQQLALIKGQGRRREFLAARQLLHQMSGRASRGALAKDHFGKPHLIDSDYHISISHTQGLSAAIAHPNCCGIDIQIFVPKISRIAPRFMGQTEWQQLNDDNRLTLQHLTWSAKEAMYKAYGKRELDFREHLFVDLAEVDSVAGQTAGWLKKGWLTLQFKLHYQIFAEQYMLVFAVETT